MGLHQAIVEAMEKMGIRELNEVQRRALPPILSGEHTLVLAPTGSGKTEAALIPVLHRLLVERWPPTSVLYITPLRALNRDLLHRIRRWGELLKIRVGVRHGDTSAHERSKQAKNPPHILITTPETLQAILPAEKMGEHLRNVRAVIVDEVHELVGEKRGYQLSLALERLVLKAGEFQRIGLSATVGSPHLAEKFLAGRRKVRRVDVTGQKVYKISVLYPRPDEAIRKEAQELKIPPDVYARLLTILDILRRHRQVITFVNTRNTAEQLAFYLKALHTKTEIHHSSLSKDVRLTTEALFRRGEIKHIIATSSLELGIDIGEIDAVIQYGSPRQVIRLVQRVGRSGHRWDRPSIGYIIAVDPLDRAEATVIKDFSEGKNYEPVRYEEKPLDVLAHQIAGLLMDWGEVEVEDIVETFRNAFPYFELTREDVEEVVAQLESERYLRREGERIRRTGNTWRYYYNNLSMIPDEEKYFVVDVEGKRVAVLDEEFVAEYLEPGVVFVVRGRPWRVLAIEGREIRVEGAPPGTAAIPAWIGEQIPVEEFVAEEVRRRMEEFLGYREPEEVVIEGRGEYVIVHSFLGSRGNAALGRFIAAEITRKYGIPVRVVSSPYVVVVEFPSEGSPEAVREILEEMTPSLVELVLERWLPRTSLFRSRFIHVARRFGLISRGARLERVNVKKIVEALTDSPIFKETLKEIYTEKLDVEAVKRFATSRKEFKIIKGLTPLGRLELSRMLQLTDVLTPEDPRKVLLEKFKERILNKRVHFICTYCGFVFSKRVGEVEEISCPVCGSPMVALSKDPEKDKEVLERGSPPLRYKSLIRSAELIKEYGKRAVVAMAVEGIGSLTASRILSKPLHEEEFWLALLDAEREYFRTRMFWRPKT